MESSGSFIHRLQFFVSINLGFVPGLQTASFAGYNPSLDMGVEETIWPLGGNYVWPNPAGENMEISSTNPADNQLILIQGLDGNGLQKQEVVQIASPSAPVLGFGRINFMINVSGTEVQGTVSLRAAGGGSIYSQIYPQNQRSFQMIYTLPSDHVGFLLPSESTINAGGGSGDSVTLGAKIRPPGGVFTRAGRWGLQKVGSSAFLFETYDTPILPAYSDLMLTGTASANGIDCSARVPLLLYKLG